MGLYAATIFLSAFLLFQVQPLIGKFILPWFGGGPAVWTTCLLFFQAVLLAGYAYAHALRSWLGERAQVAVHLVLVAAALLYLPLAPSAAWKPDNPDNPTWRVLAVLATSVGLPYMVLAATSPLVQAWFATARPGKSPYRLYALSNAGSLLALASYPLLFEPLLRLKTQSAVWSSGFVAFAALISGCAVLVWRARKQEVGSLLDGAADLAAPAPAPAAEVAARPGWACGCCGSPCPRRARCS